MRKNFRFLLAFVMLLTGITVMAENHEKPRVIVLTDIENEPDDAMSLVRFLTYSNQWDVEGLIATTSVHQKRELATWRIKEIVEAYGKVQPNLLKHESGYPTSKYLLSVVKDRDPRLAQTMWIPGDLRRVVTGEDPLYFEKPFIDLIGENKCLTGYQLKKGSDPYVVDPENAETGVILFRLLPIRFLL